MFCEVLPVAARNVDVVADPNRSTGRGNGQENLRLVSTMARGVRSHASRIERGGRGEGACTLGEIEAKLVDTPAEGMEGLVVKLGLHCFLNEHADAASAQSDSAYRDLVRLTGQDPAVEIAKRFEQKAA